MGEPVKIDGKSNRKDWLLITEAAATVYGPDAVLLQVSSGDGDCADVVVDRRELEAALIVATDQRCFSTDGDLFAANRALTPDWPERLLAERYPPPEQWERCPVADVQIGDTVRGNGGPAFEVEEKRIRKTTTGLYGTTNNVTCGPTGTVERLVKP